jgi:CRISPR/Cas system-associated exonuclease Cas4 (RecB family)
VEAIKKVPLSDFESSAYKLVDSYITPGVATEVSLSFEMKTNIINVVEDLDGSQRRDIFLKHVEKAQNEISLLLTMGAYPRFLKSNYFRLYKVKSGQEKETVIVSSDDTDSRIPEKC